MNAKLRTTILLEPRPADAGDVRLVMKPPGWQMAWQLEGGRRVEPFGPIFLHVSQAHEAAVEIRLAHGLG